MTLVPRRPAGSSGFGTRLREPDHSTPLGARFGAALTRVPPLLLLLVLPVLATTLLPAPALADSFTIDNVRIEARVAADGSMTVTERRTVSFTGSFSRLYWELGARGSRDITVVGISGPGGAMIATEDVKARPPSTYAVRRSTGVPSVQAFFRLTDTVGTFTLRYRVRGAAVRWLDTGELYWQFVGAGWKEPTRRVKVTLRLPAGVARGDVTAWAHGPLDAAVRVLPDGRVRLSAAGVPPETLIETRVLFPAAALTAAPVRQSPRLRAVLTQERRRADQADAARGSDPAERTLGYILAAVLGALALVQPVVLLRRHGREQRVSFEGKYYRDLPDPDLSPAMVGALWRGDRIGQREISATVLDLADRGVVTAGVVSFEKRGLFGARRQNTCELALDRTRVDALRPQERQLVALLFDRVAASDTLRIDDLRTLARERRPLFRAGLDEWTAAIWEEARQRGFTQRRGSGALIATMLCGFAAVAAGIGGAALAGSGWPAVAVLSGVFALAISPLMRRRMPAAAELHARYQGVRNYLRDFGGMDERPPASVVLWQRFLVLAVVFDMVDEVMESLKVKAPEIVRSDAFATIAFWVDGAAPSPLVDLGAALSAGMRSSGAGFGGGFPGGAATAAAEDGGRWGAAGAG